MTERMQVIGNIGFIINDVLKEGRDTDAWSYPKLLSILLNFKSNKEGHSKQLLTAIRKDAEWIDFLYFSPLGRVGVLFSFFLFFLLFILCWCFFFPSVVFPFFPSKKIVSYVCKIFIVQNMA
eukprot:TRINITY_DN13888_c0_g1_i1.p1 TRINITY_DN13888_c0_g1~~TRINITY_DN13888_c0_g1_i1.p1  ORF type:complete len:122 (+),score=18.31 TRINITY_DN13888_c0_g1_i1:215-580(+)